MDSWVDIVNRKSDGVYVRVLCALTHEYWTLPIWVEYLDGQEDVAMVRIGGGLPLLQVQRTAAASVLDSIGRRVTTTKGGVLKADLESKAEPSDLTAEEIVDWRPTQSRVKSNSEAAVGKIDSEFFNEFVRQGLVKNIGVAKVLWRAFMMHSLHWLINRGRTLDLLFCEIHPLPFRPNWKTFLLTEELKFRKSRAVKPSWVEGVVQTMATRAKDKLFDPRILFFNRRERYIYWSLEVKPHALWHKTIAAREDAKKSELGGGYFSAIVRDIRASTNQALRCYAAYLREISKPGFDYRIGCPSLGRNQEAFEIVAPPAIVPAPDAILARTKSKVPSELFSEAEEKAYVSELPGVQPPVQDLRHSG